MHMPLRLRAFAQRVSAFPWGNTAHTLRERFREDHLALSASSLTFTTSIALVPLFTVALAIFAAFPMFGKLQVVLQRWLMESLVPEAIARQVLTYLTRFAVQAGQLGGVGVVILLVTALALILTIERTLNTIWRVPRPRPLTQRVVMVWATLTLGPLLLGASIGMTSYAVTASRGLFGPVLGGVGLLLDMLQFLMVAGATTALYHYVPNTRVRWSHAWAGGLFVATGLELAKQLLVWYLGKVPTYSMVYGTFATVPILLVWIYLVWMVVLLGAVITAYMPTLLVGVARRRHGAGWRFQVALETLQALHHAAVTPARGLAAEELAVTLRVTPPDAESALDTLVQLDWVARLDEERESGDARYVLLADPDSTLMGPLMQTLLLQRTDNTEKLWARDGWAKLRLREVL